MGNAESRIDSMRGAKVIQVVCVEFVRGLGKSMDDPCRRVFQYYSPDGELLAERDAWRDEQCKA